MNLFNDDDDKFFESDEDKLFNDSFELTLSDYECQEMEDNMFNSDFMKKFDEINTNPEFAEDKMKLLMSDVVIKMLYNSSKDSKKLITLIKNTSHDAKVIKEMDPFLPCKINEKLGINLTPYFLFALWKRGLIVPDESCNVIKELYNKHRNFHKDLGKDSFQKFLGTVCLGLYKINTYYENNMEEIIKDQIDAFEKEWNTEK